MFQNAQLFILPPQAEKDRNDMTEHYFFYIGLTFILIHEMDAVRLQEWKMFPILSGLNDQTGYLIFTSLHIPLYGLLFGGLGVIKFLLLI